MTAPTEVLLRSLCQDPSGATSILTTDDYTNIIAIEPGDVYRAAALACREIAATFAQKVKMAAGPVSMELQQRFEHYMELASIYDTRAREGGGGAVATPILTGVSIDEMQTVVDDTDIVRSKFEIDQDSYVTDTVNQNDLLSTQEEG